MTDDSVRSAQTGWNSGARDLIGTAKFEAVTSASTSLESRRLRLPLFQTAQIPYNSLGLSEEASDALGSCTSMTKREPITMLGEPLPRSADLMHRLRGPVITDMFMCVNAGSRGLSGHSVGYATPGNRSLSPSSQGFALLALWSRGKHDQ